MAELLVEPQSARSLLKGFTLEMTAKDVPSLEEASRLIPPATNISITFLPGEHAEARVQAATRVRELGFNPVPHISARRLHSETELNHFLSALRDRAEISHAFVVAGDPAHPMGPYEDALAVIKSADLPSYGIKTVGISGYPEGHPAISEEKLWRALAEKVKALGEQGLRTEIMTQFVFDEDAVVAWLAQVRARGIEAPVRIGVPGPASVKTLLRFAARCGVGASTKVMMKYGASITKLLSTTGPDNLVQALANRLTPERHGQVYLHLYPFGGLKQTVEWRNAFLT